MVRVIYRPNLDAYRHHYGAGGLDVFRGEPYQEGYGLGNTIGSIFRSIGPLVAKTAGKHLLRTGANVLSDVVSGRSDIKTSIKKRGIEGVKGVFGDIVSGFTEKESGEPVNKHLKTTSTSRTTRRGRKKLKGQRNRRRDIFD